MVQPAVEGGGFEHRVFAAHLVGEGRNPELVFDAAHDVQVGHAGFDHHHVRPFGNIHGHFAQGLVAIGRVHLVGFFVAFAEVARRAHRIAEGAVKRAGVLGAVGHDAGVGQLFGFQGGADGADAAVHHVARRHDINTRARLGQRLLHQLGGGLFVQDVAVFFGPGVGNAVLPVGGERVQSHVGHDAEVGELLFQGPHHARD